MFFLRFLTPPLRVSLRPWNNVPEPTTQRKQSGKSSHYAFGWKEKNVFWFVFRFTATYKKNMPNHFPSKKQDHTWLKLFKLKLFQNQGSSNAFWALKKIKDLQNHPSVTHCARSLLVKVPPASFLTSWDVVWFF